MTLLHFNSDLEEFGFLLPFDLDNLNELHLVKIQVDGHVGLISVVLYYVIDLLDILIRFDPSQFRYQSSGQAIFISIGFLFQFDQSFLC